MSDIQQKNPDLQSQATITITR